MTSTPKAAHDIMLAIMDKQNDAFAWVDWMIAEREKREWSQAQLGRKVGVSRQTINDYESRRRKTPDEKILSKISVVFGRSDDFLPRLAHLLPPAVETDQWVNDMNYKMKLIAPSLRDIAETFINSLVEDTEKPARRSKPKQKTSTP
jgi:transcriptional regulator with XRE-family HTH domain